MGQLGRILTLDVTLSRIYLVKDEINLSSIKKIRALINAR